MEDDDFYDSFEESLEDDETSKAELSVSKSTDLPKNI